jgi:hypothetical protein
MVEKTAVAQREEADLQAARNGQRGVKDPNYLPPASTPVPVPTGILEGFSPLPGWGRLYHMKNAWQQLIDGDRIVVYAGSVADDPIGGRWNTPEQGAVKVTVFPANGDNPTGADYLSPSRSGALVITSAAGTRLTLTTVDGSATFTFDVANRIWTTSN